MNEVKDVAVAGAGIGGLTVALGLAQKGINVTVFEQANELSEVGAGLQMSPNAMKVLQAWGLDDALRPYAFVPENATMRHFETGAYFLKSILGEASIDRYGAPYWHLHRADLHRVLVDACRSEGVILRLGESVTGYKEVSDGQRARLLLSETGEFETDLIVGSDGIRSVIREQMLGKALPVFTGQVAWRGVIPVTQIKQVAIKPDACVWVGPKKHVVTYYLRGGDLVNFVAVEERSKWHSESWQEEGDIEQLRATFSGWHPEVSALLKAADSTFLWALNGRKTLSTWYQGRVVLLGDACHPMLPFMAQGAAMAIEDAYILVNSLAQHAFPEALAVYESVRKPRTTEIQQVSKDNAALYHMHGGVLGRMKLGAIKFASQFVPAVIQSKLDSIYGYDVTLGKV